MAEQRQVNYSILYSKFDGYSVSTILSSDFQPNIRIIWCIKPGWLGFLIGQLTQPLRQFRICSPIQFVYLKNRIYARSSKVFICSFNRAIINDSP